MTPPTEVLLEGTFPVREEEETGHTVEVWAGDGHATHLQDFPVSTTPAAEGQALVMTGGTWTPTGIATQAELDAVGTIATNAAAAADAAQDTADLANAAAAAAQADADAAGAAIATHAARTDNPHAVTAAQVGAFTTAQGAALQAELDAHEARTDNPHAVTKAQVGLGSVEDTALSTWPGSGNITAVGTLVAGAVPASLVTAGTFGAGSYVFPSGLTVTTTLAVTGASTLTGGIIGGAATWVIRQNTADGSDTAEVVVTAGGGNGTSRGASVHLYGNENALTGGILYRLGNIATAYHGWLTANASEAMRLTTGGMLLVGDTTNANMTAGLTLNQGANDNEILDFKSSDVAHTATTNTEADTFMYSRKWSPTQGGVRFIGVTEGATAAGFEGIATSVDTTKATNSEAPVTLIGYLISGTAAGDMSANANLVVIRNNTTVRHIFDAEGTYHSIWSASISDSIGGGLWFLGDTSNANMTQGLTINQGSASNQILTFKGLNIAHGLTTGGSFAAETDDWLGFAQIGANGGLRAQAITELGGTVGMQLVTYLGSSPGTTKTTTGLGAIDWLVGQHDSLNALANVAAGGNLLSLRARIGGANVSRFLFDVDGYLYIPGATTTDRVGNGLWLVNDSSNANMTAGLTIQGGANDNQHFCIKNSDVSTGLTTATLLQDIETDDILTFSKVNATQGGVVMQVLMENTAGAVYFLDTYAGATQTTDTTASLAALNFFCALHDGANSLSDFAANSNLAVWGEIDSGGNRLTRMLLKADDGELHLGNTTLVALDEEDDMAAVRGLQRVRTGGRGIVESRYERPAYDYEALRRLGVVGERDARGDFLIRVQPYLNLHDGALWQLHTRSAALEEALRDVLTLNPGLAGAERALALLEA